MGTHILTIIVHEHTDVACMGYVDMWIINSYCIHIECTNVQKPYVRSHTHQTMRIQTAAQLKMYFLLKLLNV